MPVSVAQVSPLAQSVSDSQPEDAAIQMPVSTVHVSPVVQSVSDVQAGVQAPDEHVCPEPH